MSRIEALDAKSDTVVYLIDGSISRTGALVAAKNTVNAIAGIAKVVLVLPEQSILDPEDTSGFYKILRLPILPLRKSVVGVLAYLPSLIFTSIRIRSEMRQDRAEILFVNDFYLMHGAVLRILGFRGLIFTWVRIDPSIFGLISSIWLWAVRKSSDRVIAVSRNIQSMLPYLSTNLIYDTVSPIFERLTAESISDNRSFVYVGNYIPGKGQDIAIEAFARVAKYFPKVRLEFYGSDMGMSKNAKYREKLIQKARECGVINNTYFGGFVNDPGSVMSGKFAALNMSRSESFSMTVLEASAIGLPVVASKSGGPEEIILEGITGFLVPIDDVEACALAMLRLLQDPERARMLGLAGRKWVRSRFSKRAFRNQLLALLEDCC